MATDIEFINYILERLEHFNNVTYRKMFGEYMIYLNAKPCLLVCDNTIFIKKLSELERLFNESQVGYPYNGAKLHYVLDVDNRDLVEETLEILEKVIPVPKKKIKK